KREALSGQDVEERCRAATLAVNKTMVPGDPRPPRVTSGVRVGTAAATTRGLGKGDFDRIAEVLVAIVKGVDPSSQRPTIERLCAEHPLP
ncbi:MAG: serine hydroxymethyltransferase, partial [Planctomycetes bacterium]|nr:serine hydroxymethyltransferase [Planctomycetota bacterium]